MPTVIKRRRIKLKENNRLKTSTTDSATSNLSLRNLLIEALENSSQINVIILQKKKTKEEMTPIASKNTTEKVTTLKYRQEQFQNYNTTETNTDCTLQKWAWTCKYFKSWNKDIF